MKIAWFWSRYKSQLMNDVTLDFKYFLKALKYNIYFRYIFFKSTNVFFFVKTQLNQTFCHPRFFFTKNFDSCQTNN